MTDKRIPNAVIRRLWLDPALTRHDIGAQLGISIRQVKRRAVRNGLAPRTPGKPRLHLPEDFAAMWHAGVRRAEIAQLLGCSENHLRAVAREHGLSGRRRVPAISLATYRLQQAERADRAIRSQRLAPIIPEADHA